jgi:hypothetical protein
MQGLRSSEVRRQRIDPMSGGGGCALMGSTGLVDEFSGFFFKKNY